MLTLALLIVVLTSVTAPAASSPVFVTDGTITPPFPVNGPQAAFGRSLTTLSNGDIVAIGRFGGSGQVASVLRPDQDVPRQMAELQSAGPIAAGGTIIAAVTEDSLDVFDVTDNGLSMLTSLPHPAADEIYDLAVAERTVAVSYRTQDGPRLQIHTIGPNHEVDAVLVDPGLDRAYIALTTSGDRLAISGVSDHEHRGDAIVLGRVSDGVNWEFERRFGHIGGGEVVGDADGFLVQGNVYFPYKNGPWSLLKPSSAGVIALVGELPAVGSSAAMEDATIAIGNPSKNQLLLFERIDDSDATVDSPERSGPQTTGSAGSHGFRFLQASTLPDADQFGASIAFVDSALFVGDPGATVSARADEGLLFRYAGTDGPVGCTIIGTPGDDELIGSATDDVICGLGGDDKILGRGGDDTLIGGAGDDRLFGGAGADRIRGDEGDDVLNGGNGRDNLQGGDGNDIVQGGDGNDTASGGDGDDTISGNAEDDRLDGGDGHDVIAGGPGNDESSGGPGNDRLLGGPGDDVARGGSGDDFCDGGAGNNTCS